MNKAKKTNKAKTNEQTTHIEAFLFCPKVGDLKKQNDLTQLFKKTRNLDDKLGDCIVFLNLPTALQFSKFMNTDHVLLRAYVEQAAIEGRSDGLMLKKGFVTKQHIHGGFPGWAKGEVYMENPHFAADEILVGSE